MVKDVFPDTPHAPTPRRRGACEVIPRGWGSSLAAAEQQASSDDGVLGYG